MSVRVLVGDALAQLRTLPSESVQLVCTSPPYFGLRSYSTAPQVWGGDPEHEHGWGEPITAAHANKTGRQSMDGNAWDVGKNGPAHDRPRAIGAFCPCGAWRGELGSEPDPGLFIEHLLTIFDEVWRALRKDGTCWVNIGDSYSGSGKGPTGHNGIGDQEQRQGFAGGRGASSQVYRGSPAGRDSQQRTGSVQGIPAKNLLLVPQRFAIGMQERGWIVRSEICWAKKSSMPESVRDRPTSAWEPIWMFSKSAKYFYDQESVKVEASSFGRQHTTGIQPPKVRGYANGTGQGQHGSDLSINYERSTANLRNFWLLGPSPFADAHFATFPPEIPRRAILAGTSEKGACSAKVKKLQVRSDLTPEQRERVDAWLLRRRA